MVTYINNYVVGYYLPGTDKETDKRTYNKLNTIRTQ